MRTFARRSAGFIAAIAIVTAFTAGCDKDSKDSKSDTAAATTTAMAAAVAAEHATETKIATRDGELIVSGDFLAEYNEMGGVTGPLGLPTAAAQDGPGGGKIQEFAGGAIVSSPAAGIHVVWGEIRKAWEADGGPGGALGYPTTDETDITGGKQSDFTGGTITWVDNKTTITPK
ncbi:esterase [Nocardia sp. SYP-A9097]|uniref:LGFP repeat-containing protein n=1 Tax=Nocardia sp. SYP-A9097 TaxID=2663237 RepID=UPI00129A982B|nr:esterase [Nocardia sp. SYP-A9097]MRH86625.1 esterase [Nocardia sp. SYP-A9097]